MDNIVKNGGIAQCWRCDISQVEEVNECARQINVAFGITMLCLLFICILMLLSVYIFAHFFG